MFNVGRGGEIDRGPRGGDVDAVLDATGGADVNDGGGASERTAVGQGDDGVEIHGGRAQKQTADAGGGDGGVDRDLDRGGELHRGVASEEGVDCGGGDDAVDRAVGGGVAELGGGGDVGAETESVDVGQRGLHGDGLRIEQERAAPGDDGAVEGESRLAGDFYRAGAECGDGAVEGGAFVGPDDHFAACDGAVGDELRGGADVGLAGIEQIGVCALIIASNENRAALNTAGIEQAARDEDALADELDVAAVGCRGALAGGGDGAVIVDRAARGFEEDATAGLIEAGGADDAFVVDREGVHVIAIGLELGLHGLDQAAVKHGASSALNENPFRARFLQQDLCPSRERHCAGVGVERTGVLDLTGDQDDVAAECGDGALVGDRGIGVAAEKEVAALQKILVAEILRACDEGLGIDHAAGADDDAIGVDEVDGAIGLQRAVDGGEIAADHTIEDRTVGGRLDEFGEFPCTDGEVLPVDDRALCGRSDHQGARASGDLGGTTHDIAARRIGAEGKGSRENKDCEEESMWCSGLHGAEFIRVDIEQGQQFFRVLERSNSNARRLTATYYNSLILSGCETKSGEARIAMKLLITCLGSCKYYVLTLATVILLEVALSGAASGTASAPKPLIKPKYPRVQVASLV